MNYKYVLTETVYRNGEHTRKSYGIAAISTEDNLSVLGSIEDISVKPDTLTSLVELCNREQLDISQLPNVIDDFFVCHHPN